MLFANLKLLSRRSGSNHARSHYAANLYCREAHTSCRTKHEQRLSWLKLRPILERMMRCPICQHKGRSSSELHILRYRNKLSCFSNDLLSKTAHTNICNHPSTNLECIYSLTELLNDASNLTARNKREWRL